MHYLTIALLLLSLLSTGMASGGRDSDDDHDRVYRARQDNRVLPLETILEKLNLSQGTRLLEVEYEREHGIDIYEIEYLTEDGDIFEVKVDASTGDILKQERD